MRSTAEMRLKFYWSDGKSYSTINKEPLNLKIYTFASVGSPQFIVPGLVEYNVVMHAAA
jgi:hypothetical protein